ncbi:TPA: hypothetical protein ACJTOG_002141 [Klebsiella aerogenes]|uniref:hypothetical protein n=1 Tax=Klebsiella TaxID=570 RepID=UPI001BD6178B|nr:MULTISPECIES: hypothetical protein [Klebsiella]EKV8808954.1 hypothetical protein [Klebsiella aerogenes]ELJ2008296.1 hypothetical protein [Klebsiella aerogenes]MDU9356427.1 hypothetical protein [Klebsiella sp. 141153]HCM7225026.1 hypothetical protein [Klebsiella aerogenes]HCT3748722.1 hypothetical protein [Klebsiella aerogenes]
MNNPLVVETSMLIAAVAVGVISQNGLSKQSDARNILFLVCLLVGVASALSLLFDGLLLLFTGDLATGSMRIIGPFVLLIILWKPVNVLVGKIDDFLQRKEANSKRDR